LPPHAQYLKFDDSNGSNNIIVEKQWKEKRDSILLDPDHDINADNTDYDGDDNIKVAGAFKNLISGERLFLKSYIQLWCSKTDPTIRSHVFCYDRPCYPDFDKPGELSLYLSQSR
jgi:hypothetical protein